ncbi:MAG: DUF3014 domain-containing protein [Halioglobus sp.]|nr:DUF3014 domain-containing protein [Halioglobus sp.]
MKANPDEHLGQRSKSSRFPFLEIVLALAIIGGLVFYWLQSAEKNTAPSAKSTPAVIAPKIGTDLPTTPNIPQQPDPVTLLSDVDSAIQNAGAGVNEVEPTDALPAMPMDGDSMLRQELAATGADSIMNKLMSTEHPINVSAAFIDGLGRGVILHKLLPGDPPKKAFSVIQEDEVIYMSPSGYRRYDGYTTALTALDSTQIVSAFHTLRPMYEQAFQYLGLDPADFDNTIIRALDQILATPEISEPIALQPKSVIYTFADPALENLPAVQKQLLRMGPDNIRQLKQQARALREGLLAQ